MISVTPNGQVKPKWYMSSAGFLLILAASIVAVVLAMSAQDPVHASKPENPQPDTPAQPVATVAPEPVAPEPPAHNWVMRDGREYGYQADLSEDDIKAGVASKALTMVRYLGERGGVYRVRQGDPREGNIILSCAKPCDYIKMNYFYAGELMRTENMPAGETLAAAVMADAINGQLTP